MATSTNDNTLYFIVGGLVVLALIFGFIFWTNNPQRLGDMEPAAGGSITNNVTIPDNDVDMPPQPESAPRTLPDNSPY